jgi:acyl carrier protein
MVEVTNIRERVNRVFLAAVDQDVSEMAESTIFEEELDLDSLDIVQVVMDLEDEFDIEITDDEIENIATLQDLVSLVDQKTALTSS